MGENLDGRVPAGPQLAPLPAGNMTLPLATTRAKFAEEESCLARAFSSFSEAAGMLERSYGQLQVQVVRLRHELEETNRDLARSLEENRRMRHHLNRILEGLPCGVVVADGGGLVSIANPEALALMGRPQDKPLGRLQQVPEPLRSSFQQAREQKREQECAVTSRAGDTPVAVRYAPLETSGKEENSIFILRDLREQKRMEQERESMRRQQALAEMSTVLAHEIRNPLGSLELFAGLLAESELGYEARRWVEHLQAGLRTLGATVNNVLHFHSLPQAQLALLDWGELLGWAYEFLQPLAGQARVTMEMENQLSGVKMNADRHRLEQVLLNLALNAFRFMPEGGRFLLSGHCELENSQRRAQIRLSDSGPGIAQENLAQIFEPGFTTRPGSPGLGLAVCKRIVEQHGGTIMAGNEAAGGAVFVLQFPLGEGGR